MSLTEAILVVIVIVLTVMILARRANVPAGSRIWDCVDRKTGEVSSVKMEYKKKCGCLKCGSPEKQTQKEHVEFFSGCAPQQAVVGCEGDNFEYAQNDFGAPGVDFKDWVTSQSVETQVVKNHAEFVKDRLKTNQNITGRTFTPDSHASYDPIKWVGLRRPQAVPVCNPDQVPDLDMSLFDKEPKLTWKSS